MQKCSLNIEDSFNADHVTRAMLAEQAALDRKTNGDFVKKSYERMWKEQG